MFCSILRLIKKSVKRPFVGRVARWMFARMSIAIPVKRLYETERVMAFLHPSPAYPFHVLIVPKGDYPNFVGIQAPDASMLMEVIQAAQVLIQHYRLEESGYRLIVNGGPNQEMPLLHFHLISDRRPAGEEMGRLNLKRSSG